MRFSRRKVNRKTYVARIDAKRHKLLSTNFPSIRRLTPTIRLSRGETLDRRSRHVSRAGAAAKNAVAHYFNRSTPHDRIVSSIASSVRS
jgi:hypothetical protein